MAENPFAKNAKLVEGKGRPQGASRPLKDGVEVREDVYNLCPFLGTIPIMTAPRSGIIQNGPAMPEVNHVMSPCIGKRCAMWMGEGEEKDGDLPKDFCSIIIMSKSIVELKDSLKGLGGMFGGK